MPQLPTIDEALGQMASPQGLPTVDEALGLAGQGLGGRLTPAGPIFSPQAAKRIYQAFTGKASTAFGDEPLTSQGFMQLSPETEQALRNSGVWNDYAKGQDDFFKETRERTYKALAATLATTMRAGAAVIEAPISAFGQAMEELGVLKREDVEGAVSDPGLGMLTGPFGLESAMLRAGVNARRAANLKTEIPTLRAEAVLAEGEAGYFEARELTPQNAQARADAAAEAGIPTPVPQPVAPDVHTLARRVDPPTFESYDILEEVKGAHRTTIQTLAAAREALPDAVQAQDEIRTILGKVHGVEERLSPAARTRLAVAQEKLDKVLNTVTPEMLKAGKALVQAAKAQDQLAPAINSAYRQAREMVPPVTERIAEVVEEVSTLKPRDTFTTTPGKIAQEHDDEVMRLETEAMVRAARGTQAERVEPPQVPQAATQTRPTGRLPFIEGTGPLRTLKVSERIEAKAIESKLTAGFGDLPEYHTLSMADQAQKAIEFVAKSPDEAFEVAMGNKAPPRGLAPESVLLVVENMLDAAGDWEGLRRLAVEGGLSPAAKEMGRRIRIHGERNRNSPMAAMQAVQEARAANLEKRNATAIKDVQKEIKAEMRRNAPTRDAWQSFIAEITCKE